MANVNLRTTDVIIYTTGFSFDVNGNLILTYVRNVSADGLSGDQYLEEVNISEQEANDRDDVLTEIVNFDVRLGPNEESVGILTDKIFYYIKGTPEEEQELEPCVIISQQIPPSELPGNQKNKKRFFCGVWYIWLVLGDSAAWVKEGTELSLDGDNYTDCDIYKNNTNPADLPSSSGKQGITEITCEGVTYVWNPGDRNSNGYWERKPGPGTQNGPTDCEAYDNQIPPRDLDDGREKIYCNGVWYVWNQQREFWMVERREEEVTPCVAIEWNVRPEYLPEAIRNQTQLTCDGVVHEWNGEKWIAKQSLTDCQIKERNLSPSEIGGRKVITCDGVSYIWLVLGNRAAWVKQGTELDLGGGVDSGDGTDPNLGVASFSSPIKPSRNQKRGFR